MDKRVMEGADKGAGTQDAVLSGILWACDLAGISILIVNSELHIQKHNLPAAEDGISSPFTTRNNRLRALPPEQALLEQVVAELAESKERPQAAVEAFSCEAGHRHVVKLASLGPEVGGASSPLIAICFKSHQQNLGTAPDPIRTLFSLTPAESRLASELARGNTISAAAAASGITLNTARDRLKSIFAKTRTRRQAELVSLISRQLW